MKNRINNLKSKLDLKDDFEHKNTLNLMIKAIWVAPLHTEVKMIMRPLNLFLKTKNK